MKKLSKAAYAELTPGKKAAYTRKLNASFSSIVKTKKATKPAPKKVVKPLKKEVEVTPKSTKSTSGTKEY